MDNPIGDDLLSCVLSSGTIRFLDIPKFHNTGSSNDSNMENHCVSWENSLFQLGNFPCRYVTNHQMVYERIRFKKSSKVHVFSPEHLAESQDPDISGTLAASGCAFREI